MQISSFTNDQGKSTFLYSYIHVVGQSCRQKKKPTCRHNHSGQETNTQCNPYPWMGVKHCKIIKGHFQLSIQFHLTSSWYLTQATQQVILGWVIDETLLNHKIQLWFNNVMMLKHKIQSKHWLETRKEGNWISSTVSWLLSHKPIWHNECGGATSGIFPSSNLSPLKARRSCSVRLLSWRSGADCWKSGAEGMNKVCNGMWSDWDGNRPGAFSKILLSSTCSSNLAPNLEPLESWA